MKWFVQSLFLYKKSQVQQKKPFSTLYFNKYNGLLSDVNGYSPIHVRSKYIETNDGGIVK